jgi:hypothetical protein
MSKRELLVRLSLLVAVMLLATALPAAADPTPPADNKTETLDETAARVADSLTSLDLEVREGYFQLWGADECLPTYESMGSCFFNNPAAPYEWSVLPHWPDEFVDPTTKGIFGETREGYGATYRFDPHEAILIFGYLPPEAHYFGLQSYTFTHEGTYDTDNETYAYLSSLGAQDVFFHETPHNPKRIGFFNSLSDSINNVVIERKSGSSWEQFRYFIITPDRHMDREIRQALVALGVDASEIFTEGIPENVHFGLDEKADDFVSPLRYAMPLDGGGAGTPSDAWRHNPTLRLLRVRDTSPGCRTEPFPAWGLGAPWDAWRHNPTLRLPRGRDTSPGCRMEPLPAWGPGAPWDAWPHNPTLRLPRGRDTSPGYRMEPFPAWGPGGPWDAWRHNPTLRLPRGRDTSPGYPEEPFPAWGPDSPEARSAVPEAYLSEDLTTLVHAVAEAWDQACADAACTGRYSTFMDVLSAPFNLAGPKCAEIGMDCAGDTQDASYWLCPDITFDDGEVWAVIGTLATETGNATYVGLGLNNFRLKLGAKNVDYTKLEGSANSAFYGDIGNLDKFFVYYFARDCSDLESWTHGYCMEVEDSELVLPVGDQGAFTVRDYIKPGTQRAPDSTKLLPARALKLARPSAAR